MTLSEAEAVLKKKLGDTYGGPSISIHRGLFVVYRWGDAPVSEEILVSAATITELAEELDKLDVIGYR